MLGWPVVDWLPEVVAAGAPAALVGSGAGVRVLPQARLSAVEPAPASTSVSVLA